MRILNKMSEIIFWNDYKIQPKKGNILMFPNSWCFNYNEIVKFNENKYVICDYFDLQK